MVFSWPAKLKYVGIIYRNSLASLCCSPRHAGTGGQLPEPAPVSPHGGAMNRLQVKVQTRPEAPRPG